jgi:CIC family chloride channel protein
VDAWPKSLQQAILTSRGYLREHWQRLLRIREKLRFSEETFHLFLAGLVGVIGGVVNLVFYYGTRGLTGLSFGQVGDLVELAGDLPAWARILIPGLGGLAAGLVLYGGLRLVGPQGSQNLLGWWWLGMGGCG